VLSLNLVVRLRAGGPDQRLLTGGRLVLARFYRGGAACEGDAPTKTM
jgi:hypothetical protein